MFFTHTTPKGVLIIMHNGILLGMAVGAVLGAMLVEGNPPVSEMVQKGKKCAKEKIDAVANAVKK